MPSHGERPEPIILDLLMKVFRQLAEEHPGGMGNPGRRESHGEGRLEVAT